MQAPECIWQAKAELGEGARYDAAHDQVWWVDILGQKIFRLDLGSGEKTVWPTPEPVGCTYACKDGSVLALFRRSIVRLNTTDGTFDTVLTFDDEPANNRFNDGTVGPDGGLWAGSMDFDFQLPTGALYHVAPDLAIRRADAGYTVVNGPAISPDGRRLYVNETMTGEVFCHDLGPDLRSLSGKRVFARIVPEDGLPDGICVDAVGGLWVALVTGGKVRRYLPDGSVDREIVLPCPTVTSVCLGGADGRTLFVTTGRILMDDATLDAHPLSGSLFSIRVDHSGQASALFG